MGMMIQPCEWPKGCEAGTYAYIQENDYEFGYCGMHFLEWLSNLPYRDEVEDASFLIDDKHARHYRFEWTMPEEEHIETLINRPRCPDCNAQYTPPIDPDHWRYCTGRKADSR